MRCIAGGGYVCGLICVGDVMRLAWWCCAGGERCGLVRGLAWERVVLLYVVSLGEGVLCYKDRLLFLGSCFCILAIRRLMYVEVLI